MVLLTESARKEIVLFHPKGSAFEKSEIGVFFTEMLKFSQKKYEEGPKQESINKKQEKEEDNKG